MSFTSVKDSGTRRGFSTGSVRDTNDGKGWYAHISPIAEKRLAVHIQNGGQKYGPRNWEKGQPLCGYLESAKRHLGNFLEGHRDEDHLAAAMWNVMACIHTEEMIKRGLLPKELDDLPTYLVKKISVTCPAVKIRLTSPSGFSCWVWLASDTSKGVYFCNPDGHTQVGVVRYKDEDHDRPEWLTDEMIVAAFEKHYPGVLS